MTPRSQHNGAVISQKMDENVAGFMIFGHDAPMALKGRGS